MTREVLGPLAFMLGIMALIAFAEPAPKPGPPAPPSYKANCFRQVGGAFQPCYHDGVAWALAKLSV